MQNFNKKYPKRCIKWYISHMQVYLQLQHLYFTKSCLSVFLMIISNCLSWPYLQQFYWIDLIRLNQISTKNKISLAPTTKQSIRWKVRLNWPISWNSHLVSMTIRTCDAMNNRITSQYIFLPNSYFGFHLTDLSSCSD